MAWLHSRSCKFITGRHFRKFGSSEVALSRQRIHLLPLNALLHNNLLHVSRLWFLLPLLTWITFLRITNLRAVRTYFIGWLARAMKTLIWLIKVFTRQIFALCLVVVRFLAFARSCKRSLIIWYWMLVCLTFSWFNFTYFETQKFLCLDWITGKWSDKDFVSFKFFRADYS